MSFRSPVVLIALVAVPLLLALHRQRRRRDASALGAFTSPALLASVAPHRPGWRVHVPAVLLAAALALLIVAAARPQHRVSVALPDGAVMLADDTSSSMGATDLRPSRLSAAVGATKRFIGTVPAPIRVGVETFTERPILRQSPTTDHTTAADALGGLTAGGHTAIGDALSLALRSLGQQKTSGGKPVPAAIVLLSDGTSTRGADPLTVARQAGSRHIPVNTVAVGTPSGTIGGGNGRAATPVPVDPSELRQIAQLSGGQSFTVGDAAGLRTVYTRLARQLSRHRVEHQLTATVAGAGLILLLAGAALSLYWFGRPIP